jgi:hypothetical protein
MCTYGRKEIQDGLRRGKFTPRDCEKRGKFYNGFTLCCSIEFFFITTLHGPYGKYRLLSSRSNGRGANDIEDSVSVVEACLPQARVYRVVT